MFSLIDNWKGVLQRAWSIRLMGIAALLSGVEIALPFFEAQFPVGLAAAASGLVTAAAFVARLLAQKSVSGE